MSQLKLALRSLLRQPAFFATAVGALALGIAAPTALFAVVQAALLRPLPYAHASDIYAVRTEMTDGRFTIGLVASEEIYDLERATPLVTAAAMVLRSDETFTPDSGGDAAMFAAASVSEGFFELFGMPMALGRTFTSAEYTTETARPTVRAAVVSTRLWRRLFSADPALIGRTVQLSSGPVLVVGVAPETFDAPHNVDVWFARHFTETIGHGYDAYVRLAPGASVATVQSSLTPMWRGLASKYPDQATNRAFVFRPLLSSIVGDLGPTALIAFAATALLLVLAMANVANLLLARGAARARDLAVRVALGAGRRHLIHQLLAEGMVIALAAAAIGIPIAALSIRAIVAIGGTALPRADGLRFDPMVALFAAAVMIFAGLTVGLLPALTTPSGGVAPAANQGGRAGMHSIRTRRLLATMVVCEITLAIALVAGAGRLLMSARNLIAVDPGFTADGRLIVDVLLPPTPYRNPANAAAWSDEMTDRLRALGATHVGMATSLPLRRELDATTFTDIVGRPVEPRYRPNARLRLIGPDFFASMGIPIVAGRGFTAADRDRRPVVIVSQAWAAKFIPGIDPLRERISGVFYTVEGERFTDHPAAIVGVAADVRYSGLDRNPEPSLYVIDTYADVLRRSYVVTSADGRPERLTAAILTSLKQLDPTVAVSFETMPHVVTASLVWSRLGVLLMGTFGIVSLLLAGTGVFGVLAFVGAQRDGEMAVRLSLGASPGGVFMLMFAEGLRFAAMGAVLGTALAWGMGRLMASYVYQVAAANPLVLAGSAAIVVIVALVATLGPARRAAAIQPSRALRP